MKLARISGRAYRYFQRKAGRWLGRGAPKEAVTSTMQSLREFKERAWQSDKAAQRYRDNVEKASPGMLTELDVVRHFATGQILDVATGTGRFAATLHKLGRRVVAIDLSAEMLHIAAANAESKLNCIRASAFALPFADDSFETVMSFWLLVHFEEWPRIVAEMVRVAKPGGLVLFEAQNPKNFELGCELAANAPFVARLQTPQGFHAFQNPQDIAKVSSQTEVFWSQPYDLFNDNFVLQALLGDGYDAWIKEMQQLLTDESCALFWQRFEATHLEALPAGLARKRLYALRKANGNQSDSPALKPIPFLLNKSAKTPQIERSWEMFRLAISPLCPSLPVEAPCT